MASRALSVCYSILASTSGLSYLLSLYLRDRTVFCCGRVPLCADCLIYGAACYLVGLSAPALVLELLFPARLVPVAAAAEVCFVALLPYGYESEVSMFIALSRFASNSAIYSALSKPVGSLDL